ncbi:MAG: hypothetical protein GF364_15575 [Candidatus Lokiarchaeota archaeon]|nr:hypothetical protein [Candidatus Lokiarchaeota archaeon]
MSNGMKDMTRRLQKMAADGFVIPDSPTPEERAAASSSSLSMAYDAPEMEEEDDLSDLGEAPSMDELEKQFSASNVSEDEVFQTEEATAPLNEGKTPETSPETVEITEQAEENPPLETEPQPQQTEEINTDAVCDPEPAFPQEELESAASASESPEEVEYVQSATGIPKSNQQRIESPSTPADIFHNLIIDIEEANLESHVGKLILQAKETLSRMVPFHTSYFEMIMEGGKVKSSNKPNSPDLVEKVKSKIEEWKSKF